MKKMIMAVLVVFSCVQGTAQQIMHTYVADTIKESIAKNSKQEMSLLPGETAMQIHSQLHLQEQTVGMNTLQERSVNESAASFNTQLVLGYLINNQNRNNKGQREKIFWVNLD